MLCCISQICDKEWHYYVVNVEFPVVTLYMDGTTYEPYLVTNDWPIHPSHIAMQLTVGACWQGKTTAANRQHNQQFSQERILLVSLIAWEINC